MLPRCVGTRPWNTWSPFCLFRDSSDVFTLWIEASSLYPRTSRNMSFPGRFRPLLASERHCSFLAFRTALLNKHHFEFIFDNSRLQELSSLRILQFASRNVSNPLFHRLHWWDVSASRRSEKVAGAELLSHCEETCSLPYHQRGHCGSPNCVLTHVLNVPSLLTPFQHSFA